MSCSVTQLAKIYLARQYRYQTSFVSIRTDNADSSSCSVLGRLMLIGGVTECLRIGHVIKCGHDWLATSQKKQADVGSRRKNPVVKC